MNTLKLQNSIFKAFIEIFIWNKKVRSRVKANWAKFHIQKYVTRAVETTQMPDSFLKVQERPIIWQYWHQGLENAPLLIQKCIESVRTHHPDFDIKVLSFDTISEFVTIPQKYYDLLEEKKIPIAIFSDILRLYLLTTYGGTWVDATLYFTDRIPDSILDSDFYVFQKNPKTDAFGDKMSCYFIHSKQNSIWPHLIRNSLENYWADNDYLIHYFMFEHVVSMISELTPELKKSWDLMEYKTTKDLEILRDYLYQDFNEDDYNSIKQNAFMHKLSYKILQENTSQDTFYSKMIENKL